MIRSDTLWSAFVRLYAVIAGIRTSLNADETQFSSWNFRWRQPPHAEAIYRVCLAIQNLQGEISGKTRTSFNIPTMAASHIPCSDVRGQGNMRPVVDSFSGKKYTRCGANAFAPGRVCSGSPHMRCAVSPPPDHQRKQEHQWSYHCGWLPRGFVFRHMSTPCNDALFCAQ
eukprot:6212536-Pleurochrysis_carterae.AAC.2